MNAPIAIALCMIDDMISHEEGHPAVTDGGSFYRAGRLSGLREARAALCGAAGVKIDPEGRTPEDQAIVARMRSHRVDPTSSIIG